MSQQTESEVEIVEESIFGVKQFNDMIEWMNERKNYEIYGKISGKWIVSDSFFKGKGRILKKYDGTIFQRDFYVFFEEGDIGKEEILLGRKVAHVKRSAILSGISDIESVQSLVIRGSQRVEKPPVIIPSIFQLFNYFKKDLQNQVFFRGEQDYDASLEWLRSFTQKYLISCHIEGVFIAEKKQLQCIITGTVKEVTDKEIFIEVIDAFDPSDPLNDETKEFLTRGGIIQVSKVGLNKVHPEYLIFEMGEELALTRNVLSVKDLTVKLGGKTIIRNANFSIEKGDILGIIGESGAGKSTLLKSILGEVEYEGEIKVFGIDARNTKQISPFLGYVPQDLSRMYGNFNALENIVAFGRQYGIPDDILIQRGKEILKDLNIEDVANQKVDSLSGGQKRRVSIAIAMVHNPYLLFLDEPTSGLDPLSRYDLWEYLDFLNRRYNITLAVISHYLDEIEYCDSACIFLRNIGFYDWDTPNRLKRKLPGKGLALEITLEKVTVEAVERLRELPNVDFVIQRGERLRILSDEPTELLSQNVLKVLELHNIPIHSIENKVQIDVIDYFTYVSTLQKSPTPQMPTVFSNEDYDVKNVTEKAKNIAYHKPKSKKRK
ncbi:MAG: ABC transporter ATP-binding protein [Candidatus Lokiarchaeota archaeon]|nr:ABC transporter ATP-binding protein [Candidatus Lokiarchaeota archaeon]